MIRKTDDRMRGSERAGARGRERAVIALRSGGAGTPGFGLIVYFAFILIASAPAPAMQILTATDHAELKAGISAAGVSRIALSGDRIARVIRMPGRFEAEHDSKSGDLYLRPPDEGTQGRSWQQTAYEPVELFISTEKGFTYRLELSPADGGPAQILIRNPDAERVSESGEARTGDPRIAALVRLVRAAARREPLPGYAIEAGGGSDNGRTGALEFMETWRGRRFTTLVTEADGAEDAEALAARFEPGVAAAWLSEAGKGPGGGRLAVVVRERGADIR